MASMRSKDGTLTVRHRGEDSHWHLADILWLESRNHHTCLHLRGGEELIHANLVSVEHWLPRDQFWRINRSMIVNRRQVCTVTPKTHGDFTVALNDSTLLPGSRNCRKGF